LRDYFAARAREPGEAGPRFAHRVEMLTHAIENYRRGYTRVLDETNTCFWAEYHQLAQEMAPELNMPKRDPTPAANYNVDLTKDLPWGRELPRCAMEYTARKGLVSFRVEGLTEYYDAVVPAIEPLLDDDMSIRKAGKSLAVSIRAPKLDVRDSIADQRESAATTLAAAQRLQRWQRKNTTALQSVIRAAINLKKCGHA
jgi:hypothetical protein